jgi:hypothetical protein
MSIALSTVVVAEGCLYWWMASLTSRVALCLLAGAICLVTLLIIRGEFRAGAREGLFFCGALLLALAIIYVRGRYFPPGMIDYNRSIPEWISVWEHSFIWGEKAVLLLWALYWIMVVLNWIVQRTRRLVGAPSPYS